MPRPGKWTAVVGVAIAVLVGIALLIRDGASSSKKTDESSAPVQTSGSENIERDPAVQAGYVEGYLLKGLQNGDVERAAGPDVLFTDASCEPGREHLFYCTLAATAPNGYSLPSMYFVARYNLRVDDRRVEAGQVGSDPAVVCEQNLSLCTGVLK